MIEITTQPKRERPDWTWLAARNGFELEGAFPAGGSIGMALLAFGVMVLTIILFAIIVIPFTGIDGLTRHTAQFAIIAQLISYGTAVPVVLYGIRRLARRPLGDLGIGLRVNGRVLSAAAFGGLLITMLADGVSSLFDTVFGKHEQDALQVLHQMHTPTMMALFIVMAVIAAPIAEEVFFRGFIFNALYVRMPLWGAAAISGLLFGAAHMDRVLFVPLWLGGVLLAVLYAKYRNIMVNIGAHMAFNAIGVIASFYLR